MFGDNKIDVFSVNVGHAVGRRLPLDFSCTPADQHPQIRTFQHGQLPNFWDMEVGL